MNKRVLIMGLILLLVAMIQADAKESDKQISGTVKDGYALLTDLTRVFQEIGSQKSGLGTANERLSAAIANNFATFNAQKIDSIFFNRFRRLLLVFKLIMTPVTPDNGVWEPVIRSELSAFVRDTIGEEWSLNFKDQSNITLMAAAMEEEFVNLWIYLDTLPQRKELKKKFTGHMLPPPPPPPGKKK